MERIRAAGQNCGFERIRMMSEQEKREQGEHGEHGIEEIQAFVVSSAKQRSERKKAEQASISAIAAWDSKKKSIALLVLFAALALGYVLLGVFACKVVPVVVCVTLVIQVAIGVLLDQNPVWLHACVVVADVVVGFCVSQVLLMVLAAVIYVAAIVVLEILQRMGIVARAQKTI